MKVGLLLKDIVHHGVHLSAKGLEKAIIWGSTKEVPQSLPFKRGPVGNGLQCTLRVADLDVVVLDESVTKIRFVLPNRLQERSSDPWGEAPMDHGLMASVNVHLVVAGHALVA